MVCWTCHEAVEGPKCAGCGVLQPPPARPDLFGVLGLPRCYQLDPARIDAAWRLRSRDTHPDRFARAQAVERRFALLWTALLNEARRTLRDPVSRAWYLSTGRPTPPESGGPALAPDFLEEIFALRMEAEEDPDAVRARAAHLKQDLDSELQTLFSRWEGGEGDLRFVPERLSRLKYVDNLLQEL